MMEDRLGLASAAAGRVEDAAAATAASMYVSNAASMMQFVASSGDARPDPQRQLMSQHALFPYPPQVVSGVVPQAQQQPMQPPPMQQQQLLRQIYTG